MSESWIGAFIKANELVQKEFLNSLTQHPNISMHILQTVLYTFLRCGQGEFFYQ